MAASKNKHYYDGLLALRSLTDRATAVTSSAAGGGYVDLHHLTSGGSYTGTPGLPGALGDLTGQFGQSPFDVVIFVDSIDTTSGSETYTLKLQSVDANKANPTDVPGAALELNASLVGSYITIEVDPTNIGLVDEDAAFLQIYAEVGGATPSLKYFAFASQDSDQ